jgi:transposase
MQTTSFENQTLRAKNQDKEAWQELIGVENAIRPFALGRKNWLFNGSPKVAKAGAIFYSLIETCKANHIEPYKYFCSMLHRIRFCHTEQDYRKLLPQFIEF